MKFFDAGQHAEGFIAIGQEARGVIAIGQEATGVFALGQMALGFIAIGQLARGVFMVGQLAVGVVAVGQLSLDIFDSVGMLAIAGRWVKGLGFAIWPKPKADTELPEAITLMQVENGESGYVPVEVQYPECMLLYQGLPLDAELSQSVRSEAKALVDKGWDRALVSLEPKERADERDAAGYRRAPLKSQYLEGSKLVGVAPAAWRLPGFWWKTSARVVGIAALATGWFFATGLPLWEEFFAAKTGLLFTP